MRDSLPEVGWFMLPPANCRRATQNGSGGLLVSDYSGGWTQTQVDQAIGRNRLLALGEQLH